MNWESAPEKRAAGEFGPAEVRTAAAWMTTVPFSVSGAGLCRDTERNRVGGNEFHVG